MESQPQNFDAPFDSDNTVVLARDSIQNQIVRSFFGTTALALFVTAAALLGSALLLFEQTIDRDLIALARIVGGTSEASLLFDDENAATETLNALKARPSIVAAYLYDDKGRVFASYLRSDSKGFRPPLVLRYEPVWSWKAIDIASRIELGNDVIGSVFIRSDTSGLREFFYESIGIVLSVLVISIVVCGWGAARLSRRIADPLSLLVDGSAAMAQGNLLAVVEFESKDELGAVARAFNGMVFSLRGLVARVRENTRYVADVSSELAQASLAMADEAQVQQEAVEASGESVDRIIASMHNVNDSVEALSETALETSSAAIEMDSSIAQTGQHVDQLSTVIETAASSVVEMTQAIREIAQGSDSLNRSTETTSAALELMSDSVRQVEAYAQESHALSENTSSKASQGMAAVHETVEGMHEIHVSFQGMESIINSLSEKSDSIGAVVKVIQGVVEQTNLLALNAAIISAQAGEHGRAFSVVADEVRNLAERTSRSTTEITQLIESVQLGIDSAVVAMGQGATRVDRGVGLTKEAGRLLQGIGESAQQSARRAKEIVEATRSQAADIDQVGVAMGHVKSIAVQLGRGTHEQDNASTEITKGMEQMRHLGFEVKRAAAQQRKESSLITESVEVVASRIREISIETNDQSKRADQIREALQVFREITLRSATRAEQTKATVGELTDHAQGLEEQVGRFRT